MVFYVTTKGLLGALTGCPVPAAQISRARQRRLDFGEGICVLIPHSGQNDFLPNHSDTLSIIGVYTASAEVQLFSCCELLLHCERMSAQTSNSDFQFPVVLSCQREQEIIRQPIVWEKQVCYKSAAYPILLNHFQNSQERIDRSAHRSINTVLMQAVVQEELRNWC